MRKRIAVCALVLLLPVLLLSGCRKTPPWRFEPQREGSREFALKTAHFSCEGTVEVTGCGLCKVTFSSPGSLTFVTMTENQNELTVAVAAHTDTLDLETLPDNALIKLLFRSLQTFLYRNLAFEKGETDTVTAAAEVLGYPMTGVYSADGALKTLRCAEMKLTVTFT